MDQVTGDDALTRRRVTPVKVDALDEDGEATILGYDRLARLQHDVAQIGIAEKEAAALREAEAARWDVIQVDDFAPDTFGKSSRAPALRVARMA